jgi:CheY-like chemotaxis protein
LPDKARKPADLPGAIESAVRQASSQMGSRLVSVVAEYPAHMPAVEGDRVAIAQVISSLIEAAAAVMTKGEIRVRAELIGAGGPVPLADAAIPAQLSGGGPWAVVNVHTHPAGGPAVEPPRPKVEPTSPQSQGLPFGECRRIIESYGGQIWLETQSSGGHRFGFSLPLRALHSPGEEMTSIRRLVETRLPEGGLPSRKLLLVVMDVERRRLMAQDLADAGYRVVVATSGNEVHALARQEKPDLALLDLDAREPTAFDIAMVLKQDARTRDIPVLFLTSMDQAEAGERLGAVDFIVRPKGTGALVSSIQNVLTPGMRQSARILVIEPNDATRETMIMMIQRHGYRVSAATGPEEALAMAERVEPAVVLVNAAMAQERDYWLLRRLRQLSDGLEIIAMADALSEAEGRAAIRRGASGFSETDKLPDVLNRVRRGRGTK